MFLQFVAVAFWGIYAIDREMIYPFRLEEYNPAILNHFWVSFPQNSLLRTFIGEKDLEGELHSTAFIGLLPGYIIICM